tara:strand:+ start:367 stop:531 length:165 start_codon:yes stop_codon:yes gene_type:complete
MQKILILTLFVPFINFSQKIYTVNYETQADLKVYVIDYASQAGWINKSKKHLLY